MSDQSPKNDSTCASTSAPAHAPVNARANEQTPADSAFQLKDWRAQRFARAGFRVIVAAALLGVMGNGPLSRTSRDASWGTIVYDRFLRDKSRIVLDLRPHEGTTRIDLGDLFDAEDELSFVPEPLDQSMSGNRRWISVRTDDTATTNTPTTLTIHWKPNGAGVRHGSLTIDGEPVEMWMLVYP